MSNKAKKNEKQLNQFYSLRLFSKVLQILPFQYLSCSLWKITTEFGSPALLDRVFSDRCVQICPFISLLGSLSSKLKWYIMLADDSAFHKGSKMITKLWVSIPVDQELNIGLDKEEELSCSSMKQCHGILLVHLSEQKGD